MMSKTSFFNKTVFFKTVKRFWPLWLGYLVLWVLALPLDMHETLRWRYSLNEMDVQEFILSATTSSSAILAFLIAPLAAMAVFNFLYNDRSCGAFASLPVKREGLFISAMLAGLIPLLLTHVLVFGATVWASSALGYVQWGASLTWLGITTLCLIFFYGFAVLCAMLTGHTLIVPAVYVVLSFTAVVVQSLLFALFDMFLYGYSSSDILLTWLSPLVQMMRDIGYSPDVVHTVAGKGYDIVSYCFEGWWTVGIYAMVGVALLALSLLLFRKRRMESAGDVVAVRKLRPVFKYCLSFGCALVFGSMIHGMFHNYRDDTLFGLPVYLGLGLTALASGSVGYFGAEMLMKKSFRVPKSAIKGYGVFVLVLVLCVCALEFDFMGYETHVPKLNNISSVHVSSADHYATFDEESNIALARKIHKGILSARDDGSYDCFGIHLTYKLKFGGTVSRYYYVPYNEKTETLRGDVEDLLNSKEAMEQKGFSYEEVPAEWFETAHIYGNGEKYGVAGADIDIALTGKEAQDFYENYLLPDMREGNISTFWLSGDSVYYQEEYAIWISLGIRPVHLQGSLRGSGYEGLYLTVSKNSTRVLRWLEERNVEVTDEMLEPQKYPVLADPNSSSVAIIGGADGPTVSYITG